MSVVMQNSSFNGLCGTNTVNDLIDFECRANLVALYSLS